MAQKIISTTSLQIKLRRKKARPHWAVPKNNYPILYCKKVKCAYLSRMLPPQAAGTTLLRCHNCATIKTYYIYIYSILQQLFDVNYKLKNFHKSFDAIFQTVRLGKSLTRKSCFCRFLQLFGQKRSFNFYRKVPHITGKNVKKNDFYMGVFTDGLKKVKSPV